MNTDDRCEARVRAEVLAAREEYAEEEADTAEAEIAEQNAALDASLNLRIDRDLDEQLKSRAAWVQTPTSALVGRPLREPLHGPLTRAVTVEQVEAIARRVL